MKIKGYEKIKTIGFPYIHFPIDDGNWCVNPSTRMTLNNYFISVIQSSETIPQMDEQFVDIFDPNFNEYRRTKWEYTKSVDSWSKPKFFLSGDVIHTFYSETEDYNKVHKSYFPYNSEEYDSKEVSLDTKGVSGGIIDIFNTSDDFGAVLYDPRYQCFSLLGQSDLNPLLSNIPCSGLGMGLKTDNTVYALLEFVGPSVDGMFYNLNAIQVGFNPITSQWEYWREPLVIDTPIKGWYHKWVFGPSQAETLLHSFLHFDFGFIYLFTFQPEGINGAQRDTTYIYKLSWDVSGPIVSEYEHDGLIMVTRDTNKSMVSMHDQRSFLELKSDGTVERIGSFSSKDKNLHTPLNGKLLRKRYNPSIDGFVHDVVEPIDLGFDIKKDFEPYDTIYTEEINNAPVITFRHEKNGIYLPMNAEIVFTDDDTYDSVIEGYISDVKMNSSEFEVRVESLAYKDLIRNNEVRKGVSFEHSLSQSFENNKYIWTDIDLDADVFIKDTIDVPGELIGDFLRIESNGDIYHISKVNNEYRLYRNGYGIIMEVGYRPVSWLFDGGYIYVHLDADNDEFWVYKYNKYSLSFVESHWGKDSVIGGVFRSLGSHIYDVSTSDYGLNMCVYLIPSNAKSSIIFKNERTLDVGLGINDQTSISWMDGVDNVPLQSFKLPDGRMLYHFLHPYNFIIFYNPIFPVKVIKKGLEKSLYSYYYNGILYSYTGNSILMYNIVGDEINMIERFNYVSEYDSPKFIINDYLCANFIFNPSTVYTTFTRFYLNEYFKNMQYTYNYYDTRRIMMNWSQFNNSVYMIEKDHEFKSIYIPFSQTVKDSITYDDFWDHNFQFQPSRVRYVRVYGNAGLESTIENIAMEGNKIIYLSYPLVTEKNVLTQIAQQAMDNLNKDGLITGELIVANKDYKVGDLIRISAEDDSIDENTLFLIVKTSRELIEKEQIRITCINAFVFESVPTDEDSMQRVRDLNVNMGLLSGEVYEHYQMFNENNFHNSNYYGTKDFNDEVRFGWHVIVLKRDATELDLDNAITYLNLNGGGTLVLPPTTITITSTKNITSNIRIMGCVVGLNRYSMIVDSMNANTFNITKSCVFENFAIIKNTGGHGINVDISKRFIFVGMWRFSNLYIQGSNSFVGIRLVSANDAVVENCCIKGFSYNIEVLPYCERVFINNCFLYEGHYAVVLRACNHVTVSNNRCFNCDMTFPYYSVGNYCSFINNHAKYSLPSGSPANMFIGGNYCMVSNNNREGYPNGINNSGSNNFLSNNR